MYQRIAPTTGHKVKKQYDKAQNLLCVCVNMKVQPAATLQLA